RTSATPRYRTKNWKAPDRCNVPKAAVSNRSEAAPTQSSRRHGPGESAESLNRGLWHVWAKRLSRFDVLPQKVNRWQAGPHRQNVEELKRQKSFSRSKG